MSRNDPVDRIVSVRPNGHIDTSTMNLALSAIYNACDSQSVNLKAEQMALLVTEVCNDIITINLDIHQIQFKSESLVSKIAKASK